MVMMIQSTTYFSTARLAVTLGMDQSVAAETANYNMLHINNE